jgi:hypothetical protein
MQRPRHIVHAIHLIGVRMVSIDQSEGESQNDHQTKIGAVLHESLLVGGESVTVSSTESLGQMMPKG